MNGDVRLIDANVLVHAYTIADQRKHEIALSVVQRVWAGETAATTLQNVCELFVVVTRKVTRPVDVASERLSSRGS
jgi:predicted nucleic acid-binding protein